MIEDMIKFCGKCGELRDETTGLCPNCDAVRIAEGSVQMKKWEEKGKSQRKGGSFWKGFLGFVFGAVSLIILVCGAVKSLEYFNIIDISDDSALLESVRVKEDNTELDSKHTQFKNISGTCITRSINNEEDALAAIDDLSEVLGIHNVDEELGECKTDNVLNNSYYRFEQKYEGVPVYGRSMSVSADSDGKCLLITGNYLTFDDIDTEIDFNEDDAKKLIQDSYENATYLHCTGLTIYSLYDTSPEQAWSFYVNDSGVMKNVFISTVSGEILAEIVLTYTDSVECSGLDLDDENRIFTAEKENGRYVLHDVNKGISVYDANNATLEVEAIIIDSNGNTYHLNDEGNLIDEDGNIVEVNEESYPLIITDKSGKQIGKDGEYALRLKTAEVFTKLKPATSKEAVWVNKKAVTLMADISAIYDFWYETFTRVGFDGNHGEIIAVYDDYRRGDIANAESIGAKGIPVTVFSFGTDNFLAEDVIGHEYTHSVERSISGMVSQGETGALKEAYSDIFGEILQDWLDDDSRLNDSCDWIHDPASEYRRNMMTPSDTSNPDTYRGTHWVNTNDVSKDNDNGGVHKNSTVISHAAYLMWTGMGGKNSAYESLSTVELAKLFYTTLFSLPSDCTFSQFRYILQHTADILCEQGILTNKQRLCVANAMFQVGIFPEPVTYTVVGDFELCTYDVYNQLYDDYTISVSELDLANMPQGPMVKPSRKEAVVYQVRTSEPYKISLNPGAYEITLTDNKNHTEEYVFNVSVTSDGEKTVSVGTTFGMESEVNSKGKYDIFNVPDDAVEFNGHYYYIYNEDFIKDWNIAKIFCEAKGGYLATITSAAEDTFLYSYIVDSGYGSVMFGLTDQDTTDVWTWVTGEKFLYENWCSGEPNHQGGYEHYGMYYGPNTDGSWNDGSGVGGPFICEWGEYETTSQIDGLIQTIYDERDIENNKITEEEWKLLEQQAGTLALVAKYKDEKGQISGKSGLNQFFIWMNEMLPVSKVNIVSKDPRNYVDKLGEGMGVYEISLQDYIWIHEHVFNVDYKEEDVIKNDDESMTKWFQYSQNDKIYYKDTYWESEIWQLEIDKIDKYVYLDDGTVYVEISLYDPYAPWNTMSLYIIGTVLEKEGNKYWSFYDISLLPLTEKEEYADILESAAVDKKEKYVLLSREGYVLRNYGDFESSERVELYDTYKYDKDGNLIIIESVELGENSVSKYGYEYTYEYDNEMNKIERQRFFAGKISDEEYPGKERVEQNGPGYSYECKYNKEGEYLERKFIIPNTGEVVSHTEYVYEYDNGGNIIKSLEYEGEKNTYISEFEYDNQHCVSESRYHNYGGDEWKFIYKRECEYDGRGNIIKTGWYNDDGTKYTTMYEYDHQNNIIKLIQYDTEGREIQMYEYTYGFVPISAEKTYGQVD